MKLSNQTTVKLLKLFEQLSNRFKQLSNSSNSSNNCQTLQTNKPQTTNHKPQTTNNKLQTTNHKQQTTNHKQQTTNHKPFLLYLSLLLAVACSQNHSPELKRALQLAGSNRQELKSVLRHYSRDRADSLKYRAACFLIENMQWHYGPQIKPSGRFWELFLLEDSLVRLRELNPGIEKYEQAARGYKLGAKKMLIRKAIEESTLNYEMQSDLQLRVPD